MIEASVGFHCPEDAKAGRQEVYTSRSLFGGAAGRPLVTMVLIAVNVGVFVLGLAVGADQLRVDGGLIAIGRVGSELIGVDQGEGYRLVTSGFLHAGLLHLAFNMYLLWVLGQILEPELGRLRFGLVYALALLTGSLGALLLEPLALTVGASGAVFGLMAAVVVVRWSKGLNPFDGGIGALLLINVLFTFVGANIAVGGHVGGFVGGLVATALVYELPRRSRAMPTVVPVLAVLALSAAVVAASFWAAAQWMDPLF